MGVVTALTSIQSMDEINEARSSEILPPPTILDAAMRYFFTDNRNKVNWQRCHQMLKQNEVRKITFKSKLKLYVGSTTLTNSEHRS